MEKKKEESDKDESKDSIDSEEEDKRLEKERQNLLNNPESFKRKRDFFSFYSKHRQSAAIPQKNEINRRVVRLSSQIFEPKPNYKKFSKFELKPRGFGVNKIKEKIAIFEKKDLEDRYKMLNLTTYQKTYYENNELKKFNITKFKIEKMENIMVKADNKNNKNKIGNTLSQQHFSFETENTANKNKEKKESNNKLNLNLIVDYSKILNSSKITKKEKGLDLFLTENKESQKKPKNIAEDDSDESSDSLSLQEVSTNLSHGIEQPMSKHIKQKSEICHYKDILNKISTTESDKKFNLQNSYKEEYSTGYQSKGSNKNNKYILVKKNDNKIKLEKLNKFNNGIKKVLSENISDNATLTKLDNAKYKLNQANNNKIIKRQIFDMLEQLIVEKSNRKTNNFSQKINNIYDRQKLIRAFEIMPQLSSINQKLKTLIQNSSDIVKDIYNEKEIRQSVSSIFFVECIGLESIILFNGKNKAGNKKIINDIGEDIQLTGINNKKKYIKYYFQNLHKASYFLDVLINIINHLQETINITMNK